MNNICPYSNEDTYCPYYEDDICTQDLTCEGSIKWLEKHDKQIREQTIEECLGVVEWDGYTLDIKKRIEQLKEKRNE